jgi:hypothetical protein
MSITNLVKIKNNNKKAFGIKVEKKIKKKRKKKESQFLIVLFPVPYICKTFFQKMGKGDNFRFRSAFASPFCPNSSFT